jgi:diguanylate cyclase (GGDEF)-like protein/PAS domain S-box-containing protein
MTLTPEPVNLAAALDRLEVERSLRLLHAIADSSTDAIFAKDTAGCYLLYNRESARQVGRAAEEVIGLDDWQLFPAHQAERIIQHDRQVMAERKSTTYEEVLSTVDGERTFLTTKGPLINEAGEVCGLFGISRDITERKAMEEQLRIAAVAFNSHDGIIVTDARRTILRVNETFTQVTGYSAEEAIGKTPAMLKSGRQSGGFYRAMWEAIDREGHWEGQVWNRRKDGSVYAEWLSVTAIHDDQGKVSHYLGVFSDISEPREAQRKIMQLAFYDPLTGLPNRRLLMDRLGQAVAGGLRSGSYSALMLLDLDNFKYLNDTDGHDFGDQLLVEVAGRLGSILRYSDTAARLGGDEFVVLLEDLNLDEVTAANYAEGVAEKLRAIMNRPFRIKERVRYCSVSIGITLFGHRMESLDPLLKQADLALYQAKDAGRNTIRFFNPAMQAAIDVHARIEEGLRLALAEEHFLLHYQAQVNSQGRLLGAEALLRWQKPDGELVLPADFIPVAEDCGLILPIGRWVLRSACRQLAAWEADVATRGLQIAVNISSRQFNQADFVGEVYAALIETGADPARLKLELTESMVLKDVDQVIATMQRLNAMGISFSMDDFGTGHSSLANLKRLPLEQLKIDQSFVQDIPHSPDDCAIAQAIIALGTSLGLGVIAEGVETEAQREYLAGMGCSAYQGYLFGRPGPAQEIERMAREPWVPRPG